MGIRDAWRALRGQPLPQEMKASRTAPVMVQWRVGQPQGTPRDYAHLAAEGYRDNIIGYRCINLITENAAKVPLMLRTKSDNKAIENHPLLDLLARPNPVQSGASFLQSAYGFFLLSGNSYIEAVGPLNKPPMELYPLRPDRMKVIPGETGIPAAYEYTVGSKKIQFPLDPVTGIGECLHVKAFNPLNDWYGMAPIEAAAWSIDQHNEAGKWNTSLLQNGARPSGAVVYAPKDGSDAMTDEQRAMLRSQIDETFTGGDNAGRPLLLEGGMDWKEMALSPKDMDWLKGKDVSAREVALAFNVPSQLVGIEGSQTFANFEQARLSLYDDAVLPLVDLLVDELNYWLVPRYGDDLVLSYDEDAISALEPRRRERWEKVQQSTVLTINEKREAMGYDNIGPEGDVIFVEASKLPLGYEPAGDEPPEGGVTEEEAQEQAKAAYGA